VPPGPDGDDTDPPPPPFVPFPPGPPDDDAAYSESQCIPGEVCRPPRYSCEQPGVCTVDGKCSAPQPVPAEDETECRPVVGPCDEPEFCDGRSLACPPDRFSPEGTACTDANGDESECAGGKTNYKADDPLYGSKADRKKRDKREKKAAKEEARASKTPKKKDQKGEKKAKKGGDGDGEGQAGRRLLAPASPPLRRANQITGRTSSGSGGGSTPPPPPPPLRRANQITGRTSSSSGSGAKSASSAWPPAGKRAKHSPASCPIAAAAEKKNKDRRKGGGGPKDSKKQAAKGSSSKDGRRSSSSSSSA
jgi:hypothetical protein